MKLCHDATIQCHALVLFLRRGCLRSAFRGVGVAARVGRVLGGHEKLVLHAFQTLLQLLSLDLAETSLILHNLPIPSKASTPIKS